MMHRNVGEMVTEKSVVHLDPADSVRDAAKEMRAAHVASVVVTEGNSDHLEGIFTERDLTDRVVAMGLDPDATPLSAVMTPCPVTVDRNTSMREALRSMFENRLRHLPVMEGGKVVGVLSMRDFVGEELAAMEREQELVESLTEVI